MNVLMTSSININNMVPNGELSCMLSMDLRGSTNNSSSSVPPITLNLQNHIQYHATPTNTTTNNNSSSSSSGEVSASISQVVPFDRLVQNPLDDSGCPRIRNTIAWAVEMKKRYTTTNTNTNDSSASNASNDTNTKSLLSAGVSWQVNRGLAYKLTITPDNVLRGAMILRRWAHPMITCSLLCDVGGPNGSGGNSGSAMVHRSGIGLHIETGPPPAAAAASSSSSSSLYPDDPVLDAAEDDRRHETKRSLNLGQGRSIEVSTASSSGSRTAVPTLV